MADKKKEKPVIVMPVSDVSEWDDERYTKGYAKGSRWPMSGMSEEEASAAGKKLPDPKGD